MIWINLNVSVLDSPEFVGSEPLARATWLCLLRYCVGQENGGRIPACRGWKDRAWQQMVRITAEEAALTSALWTWEGDDLILAHYPTDKETEVKTKRTAAKKNGKKGGRPKRDKTQQEPMSVSENNPEETNMINPEVTQVESGRIREGKDKEKDKGKENTPKPPAGDLFGGEVSENGKSKTEKSRTPTSEEGRRIAAIFHRRQDTVWSDKERRAFRDLLPINPADLDAVEAYYAANWPPKSGDNILRHDLGTFLNHFAGEVDRARNFASQSKSSKPPIF